MLKNNGFTVLATAEITGKYIFVLYKKRQDAFQTWFEKGEKKYCYIVFKAPNNSRDQLTISYFAGHLLYLKFQYAFATNMSCICIGWPFCSSFTADTQQRYLTFPGSRMNPGSSAPSPRTTSCKSGRWWVEICGSILHTKFGDLKYSVPQLDWTMFKNKSVFQYLNQMHMQWFHWMR